MEKYSIKSEENLAKEAANSAGLYEIELPQVGTKAYQSLIEAAKKYIEVIKMLETFRTEKEVRRELTTNIGTLEQERKRLHDQLCVKLEGKHEQDLDFDQQQKITNFAAYLTGEEQYVIRHNSQSQVSYFRELGRRE